MLPNLLLWSASCAINLCLSSTAITYMGNGKAVLPQPYMMYHGVATEILLTFTLRTLQKKKKTPYSIIQ